MPENAWRGKGEESRGRAVGKKRARKENERTTNIHSHGVSRIGPLLLRQRLAVLRELVISARVVTALLDETRPGVGPWFVLAAVREGLVVAALPADDVQSVAEALGAQLLHPQMRLLVGDVSGSDEDSVEAEQREQKHRSRLVHHASHPSQGFST